VPALTKASAGFPKKQRDETSAARASTSYCILCILPPEKISEPTVQVIGINDIRRL
jgi:hypothetical protein